MTQAILPINIRYRDAPKYLGMCRQVFDSEARPYLTEIPIGKQGIAFDRLELDAFAAHYKERYGRRPRKKYGEDECEKEEECQDSDSETGSGTSKKGVSLRKAVGSENPQDWLREMRQNDT